MASSNPLVVAIRRISLFRCLPYSPCKLVRPHCILKSAQNPLIVPSTMNIRHKCFDLIKVRIIIPFINDLFVIIWRSVISISDQGETAQIIEDGYTSPRDGKCTHQQIRKAEFRILIHAREGNGSMIQWRQNCISSDQKWRPWEYQIAEVTRGKRFSSGISASLMTREERWPGGSKCSTAMARIVGRDTSPTIYRDKSPELIESTNGTYTNVSPVQR